MPTLARLPRVRTVALATLAVLVLSPGCARRPSPPVSSLTWFSGRARPAFDPDGAPDALRFALERHLSRGLVERDSSGRIREGIASEIECSEDSLTWTFRLPASLRFTDGTPVTSADVREALIAGLGRDDHATRSWLLSAVRGVSQVRAGRPLPTLGIDAPDERTLVLRLAVRDRRLLEKLAVPGVATPWKQRTGGWADAVGVGPYRLVTAPDERSMTLVAAAPAAGVAATLDTLHVRFGGGAARARSILRQGLTDVLWPVPPGLLDQPLPSGWSVDRRAAVPARDDCCSSCVPTCRPPRGSPCASRWRTRSIARSCSVHSARAPSRCAAGCPGRDAISTGRGSRRRSRERSGERRNWLPVRHGRTGPLVPESHHLTAALDADLAGALVLPALQRQWEQAGHYVDTRSLRGQAAGVQALRAAAAQVHLVESQALLPGLEPEIALLVMPLRGPAVGAYRTGWRTRDFDRHLTALGTAPGPDPDQVQSELAEDRIVLPLAGLPWQYAFRELAGAPRVHPAYGPHWTRPAGLAAVPRSR